MVCTNGFAKVFAKLFAVCIFCRNLSPALGACEQILGIRCMGHFIAVRFGFDKVAVLVLPHFGQGPIFRLAVIVVNSFLSCVRTNKKRQTHPKVNLPSMCETVNFSYGPNGAIDGIYRTAFIISLSQAVSTKKPPHPKRDEGANIIVSFLSQPRSGPRNRRPSG